jgi:hypothetical protein
MPHALTWIAGGAVSVVLHGAAGGLYLLNRDLQPAPTQQPAQSQVQFDTLRAPRQDAEAQQPDADTAKPSDTTSTDLEPNAIPQSKALLVTASPPQAAAVEPDTDSLGADTPDTLALAPLAPPTTTAALAPPPQNAAAARPPQSVTVTATTAPATLISTSPPLTATVVASSASTQALPSTTLATPTTLALRPDTPQIVATAAQGTTVATASAQGAPLPAAVTNASISTASPLRATSAKAATAWQFSDRIVTNPTAVATIQAFMSPTNDTATDVKDDLSNLLGGVDCARLSATFIPETGALEMRGHIPDPALADSIVAAMQQQVGDGIPVTANLLHLPHPQCGALTGIAGVGLPQSTDQFTSNRLIGSASHARAYEYSEGQRLQFDLAAPDYDAVVYVDYFTADGDVIHLVPNDTIPLELLPAETLIQIGADRPGKPGMMITIGPPYGQEIAVAFAASRPLYDGLRPLIEPAAPYLEFLTERVAQARIDDADFKGEWVYFFITTAPAPQ